MDKVKDFTMQKEEMKKSAALAAVKWVEDGSIIGVGTGTTVNYFIEALGRAKISLEGAVASSKATALNLKAHGIPVLDLNSVGTVDVYIDGTDEINHHLQCSKGGGGALTGEKIVAACAKKFICMAEEVKYVPMLGKFPVSVEVIPMARSFVAREIVKLKGDPLYRENFVTDYGNVILDVHNLEIYEPIKLENTFNQISGVVSNGIFAVRPADVLLLGRAQGVQTIIR